MLPGPIYIYKCPYCGQLVKKNSLLSGNTLRSMFFSDGKWLRPMLPDLPNFIRCNGCHNFFWLDKGEIVDYYEWKMEQQSEWMDVEFAQFPTIDDFIEALSLNIGSTVDDELYFRKSILWSFNDRIRDGKELFVNDGDEVKWTTNNQRLIEMLDTDTVNDMILKAELYRYQGQFDKCMELINSLTSPSYIWLKDAFEKECQANNRMVFRLN